MTLVGYPDFQEQAQWQSPPALVYSAAIANGATKSFPDTGPVYFNVSNWNATQMRISGAQILDVECLWYDAIPASAYLARSYFSTAPNIGSVVSLPNAGPYLQVNVSNLSGFADTLVAVMAFTNRRQQPFIVPTSGPILAINAQPVAQFVDIFVTSSYLYAGPAFWYLTTAAASWQVSLFGQSSNGTRTIIAEANSNEAMGGNFRRVPLILPAQPVVARLTKIDAGTANFWVSLTPDLFR